ncbi:MAG: hypothetical protein ACR2PO_10970 [Methyloligellaceae bacterium]
MNKDTTGEKAAGERSGHNGSDDGWERREAILALVDELRRVRDRASDLELGHVVRVIDAAIIATARQIDVEITSMTDLDS